jgi:hypothetical protein
MEHNLLESLFSVDVILFHTAVCRLYLRRNIPATNENDLSPTVHRICVQHCSGIHTVKYLLSRSIYFVKQRWVQKLFGDSDQKSPPETCYKLFEVYLKVPLLSFCNDYTVLL